jgi:hypothetical protein
MRVNDIPLEPRPTHFSQSLLPTHRNLARRSLSSSRPSSASSPSLSSTSALDEILDKLRKLSIGSISSLHLSLEEIASHLLGGDTSVYQEYCALLRSDVALVSEAFELFKESQFLACLMKLQHGYQVSCVLEFLEREYGDTIGEQRAETMKKKKTLIQRLEEEREEVRLQLTAGKA